ncbi:ShlA/HecA/FhaA exofamily protein [Xenorhabdus mauleonii]|uniref:ShlA/HecA/FhaA exofamily protein n=3 Tax=Xenorhabdus mauleonii TaxID=351675 RepID=A0A2G0NLY0_9GAMM|nr:ShlA/HecA/FhaA exofamily protein [Xenorhabdus mauleonii]
MDIYNTQEAITATKTATEAMKDPQQQQALKEKAQAQLKKENKEINAKTVADRAYDIAYDRALENQGAAIGGERRQAVTAVVTALQGLAGGDIKAAIASGAAPYLANAVKGLTYGNKTEYSQLTPEEKATNLLAHAILGGVIAEMKGGSATGGAVGAVGGELAASAIAGALYSGKSIEELSPDEKEKVSNLSTLAGGIAAGLATNSTAGGVDGAQTAKNAVENNFLTAKQIDGFAAKAKGCEARGDCQQINQEMRDLSLKQQEEIIAVCASNPAACKEKYGDIPANGLLVRQAIDRVLGADVPSQMKNDMSSLLAQQIEAEGVVSSTEFAHQLISRYGIDKQQAEILAGAALGAVTGGMGNKGSKPSTVATDNKGSNWSAGKGQYSTKDQGTVTTVEHPKGKHDGKSLPYFEIKSLPDIHGKGHITAVKGDAKIPVDKVELYMRGKAAGDLDALKKEYNSLKDLRIQNQREFAKNPENKTNLSILEKKIHNVERSQEMNRVLNDAGLPDTKTNNNMIIGKLLDSAKNVTPENRKTSVVVSGNNGSVRVYATWTILPDGSKRLATVQTGTFK